MIESFGAIGSWVLPELMLKGTVVLLAALVLGRSLTGASAATRHAVWTVGLALLLLLPFGLWTAPNWGLPVGSEAVSTPSTMASAPEVGELRHAPGLSDESVTTDVSDARSGATSPGGLQRGDTLQPESRPLSAVLAAGAAVVWGLGVVIFALLAVRDLFRISMITRFGARPSEKRVAELADETARRMRLRRPVRVRSTGWTDVPVTWGFVRPVVLMPDAADGWDRARLRAAFTHELAHVKRLDYLWFFLGEMATAIHWPNPLAWFARRRLHEEQERACDNAVLLDGMQAVDYADVLVEIARSLSRPALNASTAMARSPEISSRLNDVLDQASNRLPMSGPRTALYGAALALVSLVAAGATFETVPREPTSVMDLWSLRDSRSPAAHTAILGQLSSPSAELRGLAALSLGERGGPGTVSALVTLLGDPDPVVRENAAVSLARIGGDDAAEAVAGLLVDSVPSVRSVASWALGEIDGPVAGRALVRAMIEDPDDHTRVMASDAATRLEAVDVVPALIDGLRAASPDRKADLVMALGEMDDPRATEALSRIIEADPDPRLREMAVRALASEDPRRIDVWIAALDDEHWRVRNRAVVHLGEEEGKRAVAAVISALRDPRHEVRLNAAWALEGRTR